jgi:hypothetical protein
LAFIAFSLFWFSWGHRVSGHGVDDFRVFGHFLKDHGDALAGGSSAERRRAPARPTHFNLALLVLQHFLDFLAGQTVSLDADVPVVAVAVVFTVRDDDDVQQG